LIHKPGAAAQLKFPAESLPGPARVAGDAWAPATEYVAAASGTAEHVGTAPAEPAADRTASSSDQLPPTTGRTP
ncbi:hypothetical protein ACFWXJ_33040, partial [[Kitasatospora] papulosa]